MADKLMNGVSRPELPADPCRRVIEVLLVIAAVPPAPVPVFTATLALES